MKRAVFPGSFDPITLGHQDIINKGLRVFDEIIIGIGENSDKKYMFSAEKRFEFVSTTFDKIKKIDVKCYSGLTVDFCKKNNAQFIIRGLRNPADFEFEKAIAHTNRQLSEVETVFLLTSTQTSFISSSIVREIIRLRGDYKKLVPNAVRAKNF